MDAHDAWHLISATFHTAVPPSNHNPTHRNDGGATHGAW
jgi:hypothetical protein